MTSEQPQIQEINNSQDKSISETPIKKQNYPDNPEKKEEKLKGWEEKKWFIRWIFISPFEYLKEKSEGRFWTKPRFWMNIVWTFIFSIGILTVIQDIQSFFGIGKGSSSILKIIVFLLLILQFVLSIWYEWRLGNHRRYYKIKKQVKW